MTQFIKKEFTVESKHNRPFLADYTTPLKGNNLPIVLLVHGFKGFKDWGHFHLMAEEFARAGFVFFKFNMSHNGTTVEDPLNFGDLQAFGNNNFTKELDDIDVMINTIHKFQFDHITLNTQRLFIVGHSRGGGVSIIKASEDDRIKGITTWAALNNFRMGFTQEAIDHWRKSKVHYIDNVRTNQKMPLYFQVYENLEENKDRLDPKKAIAKMNKPALLIHGDADETVPVSQLHEMVEINPNIEHHIVKNGNHVFGGSHPFTQANLHPHAQEVFNKTVSFFKNI